MVRIFPTTAGTLFFSFCFCMSYSYRLLTIDVAVNYEDLHTFRVTHWSLQAWEDAKILSQTKDFNFERQNDTCQDAYLQSTPFVDNVAYVFVNENFYEPYITSVYKLTLNDTEIEFTKQCTKQNGGLHQAGCFNLYGGKVYFVSTEEQKQSVNTANYLCQNLKVLDLDICEATTVLKLDAPFMYPFNDCYGDRQTCPLVLDKANKNGFYHIYSEYDASADLTESSVYHVDLDELKQTKLVQFENYMGNINQWMTHNFVYANSHYIHVPFLLYAKIDTTIFEDKGKKRGAEEEAEADSKKYQRIYSIDIEKKEYSELGVLEGKSQSKWRNFNVTSVPQNNVYGVGYNSIDAHDWSSELIARYDLPLDGNYSFVIPITLFEGLH